MGAARTASGAMGTCELLDSKARDAAVGLVWT